MTAIGIRPSRRLAALLLFTHSGALFIALYEFDSLTLQFASALLLALSFAYSLKRHADSPVWFAADEEGCRVMEKSGKIVDCRLVGCLVAGFLVVLNLRLEGKRFSRPLVIFPDCADSEELRKLRVWLRWGPLTRP